MSVNRREVAERLRAKHRERNAPGMFEAQDLGLQALSYLEDLEECLPDGDSAFTVIADLIDPTCEINKNPDGYGYSCSRCNSFASQNCHPYVNGYCMHCGARVVNIDDAD